jgi:hemolysin activation/secretion protein
VRFQGNQAYGDEILAGLFADVVGKELTESEIAALGNRVATFYARKGRRNIVVSVSDRSSTGIVTLSIRNPQRAAP